MSESDYTRITRWLSCPRADCPSGSGRDTKDSARQQQKRKRATPLSVAKELTERANHYEATRDKPEEGDGGREIRYTRGDEQLDRRAIAALEGPMARETLISQFQFCIDRVAEELGGVCCGGVDSSPADQLFNPASTTRVLCDAIAKLKGKEGMDTSWPRTKAPCEISAPAEAAGARSQQSVERYNPADHVTYEGD